MESYINYFHLIKSVHKNLIYSKFSHSRDDFITSIMEKDGILAGILAMQYKILEYSLNGKITF